jgi:protein arginine kinase
MTIASLLKGKPELVHGGAGPVPIVLSTRIRLARNLRNQPFPGWAKVAQKCEILSQSSETLREVPTLKTATFFNIEDLADTEKHILVERHLISRELSESSHSSGVLVGRNQSCSIMVNEEDHLRIQVLRNGFDLEKTWKTIDSLDSKMEERLDYAFAEQFGYLTACPTNLGTGMRASVMMHLPGLYISNQIEKVIRAVNQLGMVVRGLFGEGSDAIGSIFQISNQQTLGESEKEILARLRKVLTEIVQHECNARMLLVESDRLKLMDKIGRGYGVLRNSHLLNSKESMSLLSLMRFAVDLGMLPEENRSLVDQLFMESQPGHIQYNLTGESGSDERDFYRAGLLRKAFTKLPELNFDILLEQDFTKLYPGGL